MGFQMDDYNDVPSRMAEFRAKHPEGSLRPLNPAEPYKIETIGDRVFVVYVAAAYRSKDDPTPGVGAAWEPFPGRTPYTRDSELQNAETSAWGRAIVAVLAADTKKGISSAEEVRNRVAERDTESYAPVAQSPADQARTELLALLTANEIDPQDAVEKYAADGNGELRDSTDVAAIQQLKAEYAAAVQATAGMP